MDLTTAFLQLHFVAEIYQEKPVLRYRGQMKNQAFHFCVLMRVCADMRKFILFICGFHWYFHQAGQYFEAGEWVHSLRTGGDSRMQLYY